jgi:hypothetical protein
LPKQEEGLVLESSAIVSRKSFVIIAAVLSMGKSLKPLRLAPAASYLFAHQ